MSSQDSKDTGHPSAGEIPSLWRLVPVTVALCTTLFCVSLVSSFHLHFLFATCAVQVIFAKLYQFYPSKWVFLAGLLIFEVGSLICGVAPTSAALIVGRSIAGLGAAGLFSGCLIIVSTAVPLRIRPLYMGLISSMHAVASVAGPIMGGAFTDRLTWRWCFYINLPFGGLAIIFILVFLPSNATSVQRLGWRKQVQQFDLLGMLFLIPSIICLIFALQWGGSLWPWSDGRVIALFVVSGVTFIIFVGTQVLQGDRATVPPRLLKNRDIWGAVWYGMFISAAMCIFTYYLPIWFQAIKNDSAMQSGIDTLPSLIGLVIFAIIGGGLASTIGYYTPLLLASSGLTAAGAGLLSILRVNSNTGHWFGYQVLLSAGAGIGVQNALLVASVAVAEPTDMPMATTILTFTQTLASSIFLPVAQSVFQNQLRANLRASSLPAVDVDVILQGGGDGLPRPNRVHPASYCAPGLQ